MKRTRHQMGHLYKDKGWWYLRFYDNVMQSDRTIQRKQIARRIAQVCDDYRYERQVRPIADELLLEINSGKSTPEGTSTVRQFVEDVYLPHVKKERRPSTSKGYHDMWHRHVKPFCGTLRLRDFRTSDGQAILEQVARHSDLSRTSLRNIKALMSGIFKHARRLGALTGINPMQDVATPKGKPPKETKAYSAEEVFRIMSVLPTHAATVVAVAAFTGLRKGEIRGLEWVDYNGTALSVKRSVWNSHVDLPKSPKSMADVPVIPELQQRLAQHADYCKRSDGFIFAGRSGKPENLDNLARRTIKPLMKAEGLKWYGWHAFRRGLATNLNALGVRGDVTQRILRHSDYSTTMRCYVKTIPAEVVAAMEALGDSCSQHAARMENDGYKPVVN